MTIKIKVWMTNGNYYTHTSPDLDSACRGVAAMTSEGFRVTTPGATGEWNWHLPHDIERIELKEE